MSGGVRKAAGACVLVALSAASSLVIAELALRVGARLGLVDSFRAMNVDTLADDRLLTRLPPRSYAEIDGRGYRNDAAVARAEVVALGDSQTYGYNARSQESWPKQLQALLDRSVYNMGIGGWGPPQYLEVLDEALDLRPQTIVVGFYLGNDLMDTCRIFALAYWQHFARERGLEVRVCETPDPAELDPPQTKLLQRVRALPRRSEVLMLLKRVPGVGSWLSRRRDLRLAITDPEHYFAVDEGPLQTVVLLGRLDKMRTDDPRVLAGKRLAEWFFEKLVEGGRPAELVVVFIPTKANALYDRLAGRALPPRFHQLVRTERALVAAFSGFFAQRGVPSVDARPRIAAAIDAGTPIFLSHADGHPTRLGYELIARTVFEDHFCQQPVRLAGCP